MPRSSGTSGGQRPRRAAAPIVAIYEGPCAACEFKPDCATYLDLEKGLFSKPKWMPAQAEVAPREADWIARMTTAWLGSLEAIYRADPDFRKAHPPGIALAALFDFASSAFYAASLLNAKGEIRLDGVACGQEVHFPYVWTCPACVGRARSREDILAAYLPGAKPKRDGERKLYPIEERLGKPGGRFIGDTGFAVLSEIVRQVVARLRPTMRVRVVGGERGEFDLVFADDDILAMAEVKAKPLIAYPLVVIPKKNIDAERHTWMAHPIKDWKTVALNLASTQKHLPLSLPNGPDWPFADMTKLAADKRAVCAVVVNWHGHLNGYRSWANEPEHTRWLRFGCGNIPTVDGRGERIEWRVSNTKILPGLDRTDDYKKGSSQVLGYGAKYKLGCRRNALRSILMGNVYAETHKTSLERNFGILIARVNPDEPDASPNQWAYVVDATLGLTHNVYYDEEMAKFLDPDRLFLEGKSK